MIIIYKPMPGITFQDYGIEKLFSIVVTSFPSVDEIEKRDRET